MLVSLADYQTADWKPVAMWALVNSIRNLGSANAQVFSTPGNIGNETTNAHDERLQLHDIDRLHDVLRRTRTRHRRRQPQPAKPLARRTRAASAIRDLNKGHTLQQIRGFLITDETDVPHSRIYVASCRPVPP